MAQHLLSQLISPQQFEEIFHAALTPQDYQYCIDRAQLINPDLGTLWTAQDIAAGLYIILTGKVRLLNDDDEPIESLGVGQYFGEYTFFPTKELATYTARAGIDVQICFLPQAVFKSLFQKYPAIDRQLWATVTSRCNESNSLIIAPTQLSSSPAGSNLVPLALPSDDRQRKISKAYFPNPVQRVGHLFQRATRRYPYYAQQSASDCGAACLVMVARYWGKKFSVNRLRDLEIGRAHV